MKCRKHSPAVRVFSISLVFSNARRVISQCDTRLRLFYLLNKTWVVLSHRVRTGSCSGSFVFQCKWRWMLVIRNICFANLKLWGFFLNLKFKIKGTNTNITIKVPRWKMLYVKAMLCYSQNLQEAKKSKFANWLFLNKLFSVLVRAGSNRRLKSWSSSWDQSTCYSETNHGDSHIFFSNCHKLNGCLYVFIQNY